ncbi:MAG: hypothetical protein A2Z68_02395 [Candidatus Nealsonbacteria bacterium RBG_13_38_11]|uniref:Ig-like domain-containing protein n=1 Tax=Candidatus Nealsonbacteria bacterium RBG_13_38_11 TaxID=1801662 RepID=A0A1G2DZT1_9BACT|nr:MAG: hypothetical protein A2Z68_02395 [Candidatus Nealsonbacteria bacterium RBG_13_38_11]
MSKEEWEKELLEDKIPPEPFEIEIQKTPEIFEGKYFIVFFTTDKQTGIDYYQIKEGTGEWQIAESPYLLKGQSLKSIIQIKAVDKAGNERMVEYIPSSKIFFFSGIAILVLVLVAIIFYVGYLRKRKKNKI